MAKVKYRLAGLHAEDLASGRVLAPGQEVELSKEEEEANKRLISSGKLLRIDDEAESSDGKQQGQKGRSTSKEGVEDDSSRH